MPWGELWIALPGHPLWDDERLRAAVSSGALGTQPDLLQMAFPVWQAPTRIRVAWRLPAANMRIQMSKAPGLYNFLLV